MTIKNEQDVHLSADGCAS